MKRVGYTINQDGFDLVSFHPPQDGQISSRILERFIQSVCNIHREGIFSPANIGFGIPRCWQGFTEL